VANNKIAIIGANGQLGTDLLKVIPKNSAIPLTLNEIDITNQKQTEEVVLKIKPDIIINTAAYHRVDDCEDHQELAFKVNGFGVKNLCQACLSQGSVLLHISTDYVFDGKKSSPYTETDIPNPQNVYGKSKLEGEEYIKEMLNNYFIVRSSGLYGAAGCMATGGLNFVESMLKIAREKGRVEVVDDQTVAPTYTLDLAEKIYELLQTGRYGIYHLTNNGQCSWYEFALKVFQLTKTKVELERTSSKKYAAKAVRPAYSVLDNRNLRQIGLKDMREWDLALEGYLKEKGYLN
jgi:dTDP-4-dehydrorhamnose reductase